MLYMAALTAFRFKPAFKAFDRRLADGGKKPKVRDRCRHAPMITTLNAILRDGAEWTDRSNSGRHTVPTT